MSTDPTLGDLVRGPLAHDGDVIFFEGVEIRRVGSYVLPDPKSRCACTAGTPRTDYAHICWKCGGKI